MLRKRLDWLERLFPARPLPVGLELVAMEDSPFDHERTCTGRQRPGDQLTVEIERCGLPCVPGVEMRAGMHALVPVHPNPDSVEKANPRHAETLRAAPDDAVRVRAPARSRRSPAGSRNTRFGPLNLTVREPRPHQASSS